jgi:hypothetical protein
MLCEEKAYNLEPLEGSVGERTRAELRARLGEDGYAAACAEGRALTLEDALALRPGDTETSAAADGALGRRDQTSPRPRGGA